MGAIVPRDEEDNFEIWWEDNKRDFCHLIDITMPFTKEVVKLAFFAGKKEGKDEAWQKIREKFEGGDR